MFEVRLFTLAQKTEYKVQKMPLYKKFSFKLCLSLIIQLFETKIKYYGQQTYM